MSSDVVVGWLALAIAVVNAWFTVSTYRENQRASHSKPILHDQVAQEKAEQALRRQLADVRGYRPIYERMGVPPTGGKVSVHPCVPTPPPPNGWVRR